MIDLLENNYFIIVIVLLPLIIHILFNYLEDKDCPFPPSDKDSPCPKKILFFVL